MLLPECLSSLTLHMLGFPQNCLGLSIGFHSQWRLDTCHVSTFADVAIGKSSSFASTQAVGTSQLWLWQQPTTVLVVPDVDAGKAEKEQYPGSQEYAESPIF